MLYTQEACFVLCDNSIVLSLQFLNILLSTYSLKPRSFICYNQKKTLIGKILLPSTSCNIRLLM